MSAPAATAVCDLAVMSAPAAAADYDLLVMSAPAAAADCDMRRLQNAHKRLSKWCVHTHFTT